MSAHPSQHDAGASAAKMRARSVVLASGQRIEIAESDDAPNACRATSTRKGWQCSRTKGHEGDHVALAFDDRERLVTIRPKCAEPLADDFWRTSNGGVTSWPLVVARWNDVGSMERERGA